MVSSFASRWVLNRLPCSRSTFNDPKSVSLQALSQQLPFWLIELVMLYSASIALKSWLAYWAMLAHRGVTQSMSRRGNCFDNAVIESFFGTLKAEYFHLEKLGDVDELEAGVNEYIHYYNHERIKLRLKGLSPVQYRLRNTA